MNWLSAWARPSLLRSLLLVFVMLSCLGYTAFTAANSRVSYCETEVAKTMADPSLKSKIFGDLVQQNLATIYRDLPDYLADAARSGSYLTDGKVGRLTEKWLSYFCQEFNQFKPVVSSNDFVTQLLSSLVTVAELTQNYPSWRKTLISMPFERWVSEQVLLGLVNQPSCLDIPYCYGTPTQLHDLFDKFYLNPQSGKYQHDSPVAPNYYQPVIKPEQTVQAYYQINTADINRLTTWSENQKKFNDLVGKSFKTDTEIGTALTPIVTALVGPSDNKKLTAILDQLVTVTPAKYQLLTSPVSEDTNKGASAVDSSISATSKDNAAINTTDNNSNIKEDSNKVTAPPAVTQVLAQPQGYSVSRSHADAFLASLSLIVLDKTQLAELSRLRAVQFADAYLFGVALNNLGATLFQPSVLESLYKLAHKTGEPSTHISEPLLWEASPGCGCTENSVVGGDESRIYYGVYPYWQQKNDSRVDYNHLTRMGYFSASLEGQKVIMPNNWRADKPFSQFVLNAHDHKVKVDLVISSHEVINHPSSTAPVFNQALIEQILAVIKTPIKGDFINQIKPVISLGASPSRTMADGVTLNFDLKGINSQVKIDEFIDFIKKLKQGLNTEDAMSVQAHPDDEYYLNIMLPAYELTEKASLFYTVENLARIENYVNVFIVIFSPLSAVDKATDNNNANSLMHNQNTEGSEPVSSSINESVAAMKAFRTLLGDEQYSNIAGKIFAKSLPLIRTNDTDDTTQLQQVLDYTRWSYLGAAFWSFPLSEHTMSLIDKRYFTPPMSDFPLLKPAVEFADEVCNVLCPLRWPLRLAFFLIILVVSAYVIASIWFFSLRNLFSRWYFLVFLLLSCIFIMLVFSCDPYWQEQQQLFLFIFILGVFGYNFFRQLAIKRRGSLP
ncbi:hypothetical protein ACWXWU_06265 [Shewanella sp. A14]